MAEFSLEMTRGDTRTFNFTITRGAGPEPLAGATLWFTAKRAKTDAYADAVIKKSSGATGGITITDAALGKASLVISPGDTSGLTKREILHCDIQLKTAAGEVETTDEGTLTVNLDVTDTTTP